MATIAHLYLVMMLIRNGGDEFDLIIADQISTGLPLLKRFLSKRIIFYCHFPDLLLVKKEEAGKFTKSSSKSLSLLKRILVSLKYFYRKLVFDRLEEYSLGWADQILVNSNFTKKILFSTFPSIRKDIVDVLYPAVKIDKTITDSSSTTSAKFVFPPFILSLNRFEKKKNIKLALEARNGLSIPIIIAGGYEGRIKENVDYLIELRSWCNSNKISHQTIWRTSGDDQQSNIRLLLQALDEKDVVFMPSVSDITRNTLIKNSKCLIYTPMNEHFGIVPLEAMSLGTPVIAMRSGGPIETVKDDGITGYLCDYDDPTMVMKNILKIVNLNSVEYDLLSERCKEHVKGHFSMTQFMERLNKFL